VLSHTKVISNLGIPKIKQGLNADGHVSKEVRMFKYLGIFIIGKNEFSKKVTVRTAAGNRLLLCFITSFK
jgi:hypothetical protein